jgi:hypothetical protein
MTDIIDLNEKRNEREKPDPEFVRKDDFGRPLYLFLLDYRYQDASWSAEVWAYDAADAEGRVVGMRESLKVMGQAYAAFPA